MAIERLPQLMPIASAGKADALSAIFEARPDLALLHFPSDTATAIALTRQISVCAAQTRVILLGVPDHDSAVLEYIEAGSSGWLAQSGSLDELISLMYRVTEGEVVCSPTLAYRMYGRLAELAAVHQLRHGVALSILTTREVEIMDLVRESKSNEEISQQLHLSVHTVKKHVHNIMEKLRVRTRAELALGTGALDWDIRVASFGADPEWQDDHDSVETTAGVSD